MYKFIKLICTCVYADNSSQMGISALVGGTMAVLVLVAIGVTITVFIVRSKKQSAHVQVCIYIQDTTHNIICVHIQCTYIDLQTTMPCPFSSSILSRAIKIRRWVRLHQIMEQQERKWKEMVLLPQGWRQRE